MGANIESTRPSIIATLATDIVLLITMLAGLLRIRLLGGGRFGLASLLWKQVGVVAVLLDHCSLPFLMSYPHIRVLFGSYLLLLLKSRQWSVWQLPLHFFSFYSLLDTGVNVLESER